jgi:hypothetical protein
MVGHVSPRLPSVGHSPTSEILAAPCPTATLVPRLKGLVPEQVVLRVCTVRSNCPWPIATALPVAPTFTTHSALQQTVNSRPCLPCLLTTKASRTWHLAARPAHPMACLLVNLQTLLRVLAILAVATMARVRHRNFRTIQPRALIFVVLSTPAPGPSRQSLVQMEHLVRHHHHLTFSRPLNSKSRYMRHPPRRFSLWWSL